MGCKVCTFIPGNHWHVTGPANGENDFAMWADIVVTHRAGEEIVNVPPARLVVTGSVLGMDDGAECFYVAPMQHMFPFHTEAPLIVKAIIALPHTAHLPYQHLPPLNEEITFTGEVALFEQGCVVVLVDAHLTFPLIDWIEDPGEF